MLIRVTFKAYLPILP